MSASANSMLGDLWPSGRGSEGGTSIVTQSYYPSGFSADHPATEVAPVLRAQQGSRSKNRKGAGPFVRAGHSPGELPGSGVRPRTPMDSATQARLVGGERPEEEASGEEMFGYFLERFSRPISAASVRSQSSVATQALGPKANTHDATTTMASSLRAARRSRASVSSRLDRTNSSRLDVSQFLMPQRSLPELSAQRSAEVDVTELDAASSASDDEPQDSAGMSDWDWERASPRTVRVKVMELERTKHRQDIEMDQLRRENVAQKRKEVKKASEYIALQNEIARLSQQVAQLTEAQVNKAAEIAEAVAIATGADTGRGRNGLGRGKTDEEFNRLRGMYATTDELKKSKPAGGGGGYDPRSPDTVSTLDARDSMAEVLGSVKEFLSEVESEQFLARQTRDQATHFAHTLDLARLAGQVDMWQSQSLDGSWKSLPNQVISDIIKAKEANKTQLDVSMFKEDGRQVGWHIDVVAKRMTTTGPSRDLRVRERSEIERAAGLLSTIAAVRLVTPNSTETAIQRQHLQQVWTSADVDGSGSLQRGEVRQVMEQMGKQLSDEEFESAMDSIDQVSCHEIAAIWVAFFSRWQRYRC